MITRENFIKGSFKKRKNMDRLIHPISVFLRDNSKHAFTVKEIVKKVKIKEDTTRSMLRSLKEDNLVEHRVTFFMWKIDVIRPKAKIIKPLNKTASPKYAPL